MNNLQSELLKKKEKLAELKQRKLERDQKLKLFKTDSSSSICVKPYKTNLLNEFENLNVDEILTKCGVLNDNKESETTNFKSGSICVSSSFPSGSSLKFNLSSPVLSSLSGSSSYRSFHRYDNNINLKLQNLKLSSNINLNIVDIFPNETIKYSKETQTNLDTKSQEESDHNEDIGNELNENSKTPDKNQTSSKNKKEKSNRPKPLAYYDDIFVYDTFQWEDEFSAVDLVEHELLNHENIDSIIKKALNSNPNEIENLHNKLLVKAKEETTSLHDNDLQTRTSDENEDEDPIEASKLYSEKVIKTTLNSDDFVEFLKLKRPVMERALKQNEDNIFFDYSAINTIEKANDDSNSCTIKVKKTFCSADKSAIVTCLDWSNYYSEYILCSYDNMLFNYEEAASESVAVLWNSKMDSKTPFQSLSCSSLITSCIFSSFHPNLIISGTYSGQIVMWDIRVNKRTPIQRSSLSTSSHMNPVYCVKVIGNEEANNLISISNDGKLCTWTLDNLNLPFETQDLYMKNVSNKNVYATCFDFQNLTSINASRDKEKTSIETDLNILMNRCAIIGTEDGLVHSLKINNNTNSNNNKFATLDTFNDHLGPITNVSCYGHFPNSNSIESNEMNNYFSQLFLTSSFDGSVKLWNNIDNTNPIHTFECNGDYVYDVCWSPTHPALFACVDGTGKLDLWNLNNDFELPSASFELDNRTRALNRIKWSKTGHEIAVGDDHGQITIFELNENFTRPGVDESKKFMNTLCTLKQINYDSSKSDKNNYLLDSFKALL